MRKIKDDELRTYRERIGFKQYRALYMHEVNKALRLAKNNKRYSGKKYINSEERLDTIKEKYKNGVTEEILAEMF